MGLVEGKLSLFQHIWTVASVSKTYFWKHEMLFKSTLEHTLELFGRKGYYKTISIQFNEMFMNYVSLTEEVKYPNDKMLKYS